MTTETDAATRPDAAGPGGVNDTILPATAAAKAGIEAMAKALAIQLAPSGATVNVVAGCR